MKVGDVVEYQKVLYRVLRANRLVHAMVLAPWGSDNIEVADNDPEVKELHNPADKWPVAIVMLKHRAGPMREVMRRGKALTPLLEWMPGDPFRPGGAIFLNPDLHLKRGEVLTVRHQDGTTSRVSISAGFGTVAQKRKGILKKPKLKPNAFDRIWAGEDDDD